MSRQALRWLTVQSPVIMIYLWAPACDDVHMQDSTIVCCDQHKLVLKTWVV